MKNLAMKKHIQIQHHRKIVILYRTKFNILFKLHILNLEFFNVKIFVMLKMTNIMI